MRDQHLTSEERYGQQPFDGRHTMTALSRRRAAALTAAVLAALLLVGACDPPPGEHNPYPRRWNMTADR